MSLLCSLTYGLRERILLRTQSQAASMHSRSSCDQEATADVVDPRRRS